MMKRTTTSQGNAFMRDIRHFIDGAAFDGASGRFGDVFNPNTGEVQARVQLATVAEMDRAVQAAQAAFEAEALSEKAGVEDDDAEDIVVIDDEDDEADAPAAPAAE